MGRLSLPSCFSALIVFGNLISWIASQSCDSSTVGTNACISGYGDPYYNDYQWATCLSDAYIKLITGNRFACQKTAYCWYQCMVEEYDKAGLGPNVIAPCLCRGLTTTRPSVTTTLPPYCYSPDGSSCGWYLNCLEKKYNCRGTAAGYAVEYGYTFCNRFSQNLGQFSSLGQQWVNSVRKCLQVCLGPLLRQYYAPTCDQIRTQAIASHRPCYLNMGCFDTGSPVNVSICHLPVSDIFQVVFTIWRSFVDPSTAAESVCGVLSVARTCTKSWLSTWPCMRSFVAAVAFPSSAYQSSASAPLFGAQIAEAISKATNLSSFGVNVLGCQLNPRWSDLNTVLINLIIAANEVGSCLKNLESPAASRKRRATSLIDFNAVANSLQTAIVNGSLLLQINGVPVYVKAAGECDSMTSCSSSTNTNVTAPWPPAWPSSTTPSAMEIRTTSSAIAAFKISFELMAITYLVSMALIINNV